MIGVKKLLKNDRAAGIMWLYKCEDCLYSYQICFFFFFFDLFVIRNLRLLLTLFKEFGRSILLNRKDIKMK